MNVIGLKLLILSNIISFNSSASSPEQLSDIHSQATDILLSLSMDIRTDYVHDKTRNTLTKLLGPDNDNEILHLREYLFVLNHTYNIIIEYTDNTDGSIR